MSVEQNKIIKVTFRLRLNKVVLAMHEISIEHTGSCYWIRKLIAGYSQGLCIREEDVHVLYEDDEDPVVDLDLENTNGVVGFMLVHPRAQDSVDPFGPTVICVPNCLSDRVPKWKTTESLADVFVYITSFRKFLEEVEDVFNPEMNQED